MSAKDLDGLNVEIQRLRESEEYQDQFHPLHKLARKEMGELYQEKERREANHG